MDQQSSHPVVRRFWNALEPETGNILSPAQQAHISQALEQANPVTGNISDVRFSLAGHFMVFLWGRERRSGQRLQADAVSHPILAAKNLPVLAAIAGTIVSICYMALHGSGRALLTLMN